MFVENIQERFALKKNWICVTKIKSTSEHYDQIMMYSKLIQCTKETIQRFKKRNIVNLEHDNNMRNSSM